MKHETKNETLKSYVSFFEMTDIQLLYNKKWNMKDKSKVLKTYGYMFAKLQFVGPYLLTFLEKTWVSMNWNIKMKHESKKHHW